MFERGDAFGLGLCEGDEGVHLAHPLGIDENVGPFAEDCQLAAHGVRLQLELHLLFLFLEFFDVHGCGFLVLFGPDQIPSDTAQFRLQLFRLLIYHLLALTQIIDKFLPLNQLGLLGVACLQEGLQLLPPLFYHFLLIVDEQFRFLCFRRKLSNFLILLNFGHFDLFYLFLSLFDFFFELAS